MNTRDEIQALMQAWPDAPWEVWAELIDELNRMREAERLGETHNAPTQKKHRHTGD